MKKNIKIFITILMVVIIGVCIGCKNETKIKIEKYKNEPIFENKKITTEIKNIICYKNGDNYDLIMTFDIISKNLEKTKYKLTDYEIENEESKAKYTIQPRIIGILPYEINLEYEIKKEFGANATIPTNITEEKYNLKFKVNGEAFMLHLYEEETKKA